MRSAVKLLTAIFLAAPPGLVAAQQKPVDWDGIAKEGQTILSQYLRINTTNPPGNERVCVEWID